MTRLKVAVPSTPSRAVLLVERLLQSLLCLTIVAVVYRYCWIADPFKCAALLNKGQWLDAGPRWSSSNPFQNWEPSGCLMHEYKKEEIQGCFHDRRMVFIGDSTTRQIFWALANKMDQKRAEEELSELLDVEQKHKDLEFVSGGVTVQFIWDPWLNSTGLDHELRKFRAVPDETMGGFGDSAGLILLGAPGLWYARHGQENFFKDFRDSIDNVIPYMDHANYSNQIESADSELRPLPIGHQLPNFLLLAPVQVPWYQSLSPSREATITPEKIDLMNDYLQQVSAHSNADVVWSFSLMTWTGRRGYEESGLHVVNNVAHRKADILLNLRCNSGTTSKHYPSDRTCCSNYKRPVGAQLIILLAGMLLLPIVSFMRRRHALRIGPFLPHAEVFAALTIFTLVICFCFYADRTQLFEKGHKQFQKRDFLLACLAVAFAGLFSVRKNRGVTKVEAPLRLPEHRFLSRDQTDEWKGWMQFFILIYHYTHASRILWVYEVVRLLVASYLFMTGFGHTLYFMKTDDYSLRRVASVLLRNNLLSCILSYMMRTDYLFYYFAPLVSFWFLVIYFTLKIGRDGNSDLNFLFCKILCSALVTTAFIKIPGILEVASSILRYCCGISWDMEEWRFRVFLDMYIVYVGVITAVLYQRLHGVMTSSPLSSCSRNAILQPTTIYLYLFRSICILVSAILLPVFWILTRRSPNKADYNWWQPYISFIPILSFVTLRNSHRVLRSHHSKVFAWLGRCSSETYVLQYHIWLAGDTTVYYQPPKIPL
ncbi:hypothetical protein B7494_g3802 [Chlorociboria aeruginascens]|nr:hypothetical protein B7494_g3802 [Chlorociboria aeruginascens]